MKNITTEDGFEYTVPTSQDEFDKFQSAHTQASSKEEVFQPFPIVVGDTYQIGPYKTFLHKDIAYDKSHLPCIELEGKIYGICGRLFRNTTFHVYGSIEGYETKIRNLGIILAVQFSNHYSYNQGFVSKSNDVNEPKYSPLVFDKLSPYNKNSLTSKENSARLKYKGVEIKELDRLARVNSWADNYAKSITTVCNVADEARPIIEDFITHLPRLQLLWANTKKDIVKADETAIAEAQGLTYKEYRAKLKQDLEDEKSVEKTGVVIQVAPKIIKLQQELNCFVDKLKTNEKFEQKEVTALRRRLKNAADELLSLRYLGKY